MSDRWFFDYNRYNIGNLNFKPTICPKFVLLNNDAHRYSYLEFLYYQVLNSFNVLFTCCILNVY